MLRLAALLALVSCAGAERRPLIDPPLAAPPRTELDRLADRLEGARIATPVGRPAVGRPEVIPLASLVPGMTSGGPYDVPFGAAMGPSGVAPGVPSGAPSTAPSGAPSAAPSGAPSGAPSTAPSGAPSTAPSGAPSTAPSGAPPTAPSGAPSTLTPERVGGVTVRPAGDGIEIDVVEALRQPLRFTAPVPGDRLVRLHASIEALGPTTPGLEMHFDIIEKDEHDERTERWISDALPGELDRWWRTRPGTRQVSIGIIYFPPGPWISAMGAGFRPGRFAVRDAALEVYQEAGGHAFHPAVGTERIGPEVRDSLFAPAGTTYAWRVRVPRSGAIFETGVGALHRVPVKFVVKVDGRVRASATTQEAWRDLTVRLDEPGEARIELSTTGPTGACAAWSNPMVVARRRAPRRMVLIDLDSAAMAQTTLSADAPPTTPWLAAMGRKGAVFRSAFSSGTWLLPTHIDIFSGRPHPPSGQLASGASFVEALRRAGVLTAGFSGGDYLDASYGFGHGFERWRNDGLWEEHAPMHQYLDEVLELLRTHRDRDLFVFLHGFEAHTPWEPPEPYRTMFTDLSRDAWGKCSRNETLTAEDFEELRRQYWGSLRWLDQLLADWFQQAGPLLEGATIVITSGHAEGFGEHGFVGHAALPYPEATWVPLVAVGPGFVPGRVEASARTLLDLAPTFLTSAGLDPRGLPGLALQQAAPPDRVVGSFGTGWIAARDERRTLFFGTRGVRTYDRTSDPGERTDLGPDRYPDLQEAARAFASQWFPTGRGARR